MANKKFGLFNIADGRSTQDYFDYEHVGMSKVSARVVYHYKVVVYHYKVVVYHYKVVVYHYKVLNALT